MPTIVETAQEFIIRHSAEGRPMEIESYLYFAGGARIDTMYGEYRHEPPPDREQRELFIGMYWTERLRRATELVRKITDAVQSAARSFKAGQSLHPDEQFPQWRADLERAKRELAELEVKAAEATKLLRSQQLRRRDR